MNIETVDISTNLDAIAHELEKADNKPDGTYTGKTLAPRLSSLMTPQMNEGFFADAVVLVEGETDRAAIMTMAESLGHDFEALGMSVLPCSGKSNLDRPAIIFKQLQIPTYAVWDSDKSESESRPEENRRLLRLVGGVEEDWPRKITETYACFEVNLETTLRQEIGDELFEALIEECCEDMQMVKKHAMEHPEVLKEILERPVLMAREAQLLSRLFQE